MNFLQNPYVTYILSISYSLLFNRGSSEILTGSYSFPFLKNPNDCTADNCPSGAYFVDNSDGGALYNFGTQIGGPQNTMEHGQTDHWSNKRYAILIADGEYYMRGPFKIGYYTQILGVAESKYPVVSPGINVLNNCEEVDDPNCVSPGGLNNFWRSMSHLKIDASGLGHVLRFSVSQAAPLREIEIEGRNDLLMCDWGTGGGCGYNSGGFIDNLVTKAKVKLGSQQQFYISNSKFKTLEAGAWNIVSNDNQGGFEGTGDRENVRDTWSKFPFIGVDSKGLSNLKIPRLVAEYNEQLKKYNWKVSYDNKFVTVDNFITIKPDNDDEVIVFSELNINQINNALSNKSGIIVMPGIYKLGGVIDVPDNKVVLGIGLPTLICENDIGHCMKIGSEGVKIAGITFDAGTKGNLSDNRNTLLTVGEKGEGNVANPTVLQDVYCRIARITEDQESPSAYSCITINADYIIGQHLWLWRGDHDIQSQKVPWSINQAQYGLIVYGSHVKMYGLFVEHFENYQTVWDGQNGTITFYQSEMPYFLPENSGNGNKLVNCTLPDGVLEDKPYTETREVCPSLYVTENADGFKGIGMGVYCYFPNKLGQKTIKADAAIHAGESVTIGFSHIVTYWLDGDIKSGIDNVLRYGSNMLYPPDSAINGTSKGFALALVNGKGDKSFKTKHKADGAYKSIKTEHEINAADESIKNKHCLEFEHVGAEQKMVLSYALFDKDDPLHQSQEIQQYEECVSSCLPET